MNKVTPIAPVDRLPFRQKLGATVSVQPMLLTAVVIFVGLSAIAPTFGTVGNADNIAKQAASVLTLGLGMMTVVLVGGVDLSVGSVVLLSSTVAGGGLVEGLDPWLAAAGGILVGTLVGAFNALLIEGLRISPVIVTLGTMIAVRGIGLSVLATFHSWTTSTRRFSTTLPAAGSGRCRSTR